MHKGREREQGSYNAAACRLERGKKKMKSKQLKEQQIKKKKRELKWDERPYTTSSFFFSLSIYIYIFFAFSVYDGELLMVKKKNAEGRETPLYKSCLITSSCFGVYVCV